MKFIFCYYLFADILTALELICTLVCIAPVFVKFYIAVGANLSISKLFKPKISYTYAQYYVMRTVRQSVKAAIV